MAFNSADEKFERRIEEYKRNDYKLIKRQNDTVKMYKPKRVGLFVFSIILFAVIGLIMSLLITFYMLFIIAIIDVVLVMGMRNDSTVNISITRTGQIEETGNVLKNK